MANEVNKVIYSMIGVSKIYEKKPVLKDIYLSYFYGAKIGVIGLNGSGKSSLLKILSGVDTEFLGKTILSRRLYRWLSGAGTASGRNKNGAANRGTGCAKHHGLDPRI